jgi:uncharacterized FAD-dependent dehydrogenase
MPVMMRINELKLPLHHAPEELPAAIFDRLGVTETEVLSWTMFRRGNDARKKGAIKLVYTIDVTLADEAAVAAREERARAIRAQYQRGGLERSGVEFNTVANPVRAWEASSRGTRAFDV